MPFAFWLVETLRPNSIVELGTHAGVSYSAMCQAVDSLGLATRCFAVDTWKGDEHAGFYPEHVYEEFNDFHAARYGSFSSLIRATFDEAVRHFDDRSIGLLHIDGFHTYEAVRHDFETWFPKLTDDAVVLFHDVNVHERGFGVFRFWEEISRGRMHFTFLHGHGLGILGLGSKYSDALQYLFQAMADGHATNRIRSTFSYFGRFAEVSYQLSEVSQRLLLQERELTSALGASAKEF